MPIERITLFCFGASYAVALGLEIIQLVRPHALQRLLATVFGAAGLLAHTLYLLVHQPRLLSQFGSLLFLAWILAVFYLYGSLHHRRVAWGVFVLPLPLALISLAAFSVPLLSDSAGRFSFLTLESGTFWQAVHVALFILGSVGVCVAFLASVMYLLQAQRLKAKALPGQGLKLLSLERLEKMNRRAINLAFPLLTMGLLIGLVQLLQGAERLQSWTDTRVLSTLLLWFVFAIVLYLRYGFHLRGRTVALLTILAFCLLLVTLATSHSFPQGGGP
jgi:ABC-type transport system involved in cytochrome c biogenesis permease subunit